MKKIIKSFLALYGFIQILRRTPEILDFAGRNLIGIVRFAFYPNRPKNGTYEKVDYKNSYYENRNRWTGWK